MQLLQNQAKADMPDGDISPRAAGNVKLDWSGLDEFTLQSLKRLGAAMLGKTHSLVESYRMFARPLLLFCRTPTISISQIVWVWGFGTRCAR